MNHLYDFAEELCKLSKQSGEDIVSQWGNVPIVVTPLSDPFTIVRNVRDYT